MIKKVLPWILMLALLVFMIISMVFKDDMNDYLSKQMLEQITPEITQESVSMINSLYNYMDNGLDYEFTFLEFGAKGCSACKRMESVMEEIRIKYPKRVNVVFLNIMEPENLKLMKFYGIATIPSQVLLNKNGEEFYKNMGFISSTELEKLFQ